MQLAAHRCRTSFSLYSTSQKGAHSCQCVPRQLATLVKPRMHAAAASTQPAARQAEQETTTANAATWLEFAESVAGEWEGVTASFNAVGEPQQLPEHFVPGAYREWGVELYDWQTQCSTTTAPPRADSAAQLRSVVRRLMPTVGCEADAVAFAEEVTAGCGGGSNSSTSSGELSDNSTPAVGLLLLAARDGSYSTGPCVWPLSRGDDNSSNMGPQQLALEHCLVLPSPMTLPEQQQQQRMRIKVVQRFRRDWSRGGRWTIAGIDVHRERYEGPFTGRRELAGCGGGVPGFAQQQPLEASALAGAWITAEEPPVAPTTALASWPDAASAVTLLSSASGRSCGGAPQESCLDNTGAPPPEASLVLLPLGVWSVVQMDEQTGIPVTAEAGVVLPGASAAAAATATAAGGEKNDRRLVSIRSYGPPGTTAADSGSSGGAVATAAWLQMQSRA